MLSVAMVGAIVPLVAGAPAPASWSLPVLLERPSDLARAYTSDPALAVPGTGDAFAAWAQFDGPYSKIYVSHFVDGVGWTAPVNLNLPYADEPGVRPAVAADASGHAAVVWQQTEAGTSKIYASYFTPGEGWTAAEDIAPSATDTALQPSAVMDSWGVLTASWTSTGGADWNAWAARYAPGVGWGAPQALEETAGNVGAPVLAVDGAGDVVAVFFQAIGGGGGIYANRYTPAAGWAGRVAVDTNASLMHGTVVLAGNEAGEAVSLFLANDSTVVGVFANRYTPGAGWGPTHRVSSLRAADYYASVTAGASGAFEAVWVEQLASGRGLMTARADAAGEWAQGVAVATGDSFTETARVLPAPDGSAVLVGGRAQGAPEKLISVERSAAGAWGAPAVVDPDHGRLYAIAAAGSKDGSAFAVIIRYDESLTTTYASQFAKPDTTAPFLSVTAPTAGESTGTPTVYVYGMAEAGAEVWVAGARVATTPELGVEAWSARVALLPGANPIPVLAYDAAGNMAAASVTVTYNDPVPALRTALNQTTAALNATQGELGTAQASLATAQGQLAAAQAELTATRSALNTTRTELAAAQAATAAGDAALQAKVDSSGSGGAAAMLLGLLGVVLGAAAIAMSFVMSRRRNPLPEPRPGTAAPEAPSAVKEASTAKPQMEEKPRH